MNAVGVKLGNGWYSQEQYVPPSSAEPSTLPSHAAVTTPTPAPTSRSNRRMLNRNNSATNRSKANKEEEPKQAVEKQLYKFSICGIVFDLPFDRFVLEMALDRNFSIFETLLIIFIATLISYLSSPLQVVYSGLIQTVVMSFAIASAHFSLLKAPQPDAHSPVHHNPLVTYSRSFYFIVLSIVAIIAHHISVATTPVLP